ncbi:MAG: restriction endonuclease subunit S [Nitrospira sp.]|nr:restriction endonuclease subunit S [Nitrospira sp.]
MTAKIVDYLQDEFQEWDVDHEYNRDGNDPKRGTSGTLTTPDIIIHRRGTNENFIVIEVKKERGGEDLNRLREIATQRRYRYAFAITIDQNRQTSDWISPIIFADAAPQISILPDWPMVKLGEHFTTSSGGTPSKANPRYWKGTIPWVSPKDMKSDLILDTEDHISEEAVTDSATKLFPAKTVVCVVRSGILKHSFPVALLSRPMCINQDLIAFQPKGVEILSEFLFYVLKTHSASILVEGIKPGVTVQSFYNGFFKKYKIPLPPPETQRAIVAEIEAEQALVNANRELITRMEKKIQATLVRVWGEENQGGVV